MSAPKQTLSHLPLALVPSEAMQKRADKYQFLFPFQEAVCFPSCAYLQIHLFIHYAKYSDHALVFRYNY